MFSARRTLVFDTVTTMLCGRQVAVVAWALLALVATVLALPDSAGHYPDPPPGISHGGIPYGSVSGDVAAYYKSSAPSRRNAANSHGAGPNVDYAPIEQWL